MKVNMQKEACFKHTEDGAMKPLSAIYAFKRNFSFFVNNNINEKDHIDAQPVSVVYKRELFICWTMQHVHK